MQFLHRLAKPLFWAALLVGYVAAVMPANEAPSFSPYDKVEHMVTFLTLAVLARAAYPRIGAWVTWLLLGAFGALIELSQMIPAVHRDGEFADWLADAVGFSVGIVLVGLATRALAPHRS